MPAIVRMITIPVRWAPTVPSAIRSQVGITSFLIIRNPGSHWMEDTPACPVSSATPERSSPACPLNAIPAMLNRISISIYLKQTARFATQLPHGVQRNMIACTVSRSTMAAQALVGIAIHPHWLPGPVSTVTIRMRWPANTARKVLSISQTAYLAMLMEPKVRVGRAVATMTMEISGSSRLACLNTP